MPSETRDREAEGHARLKHDGPRRRDRSADSSAVVSGRRAPVCRQDAVHDVLVDIDPERLRDDARNTRAPEPRIARLELDDGADEGLARPRRSGLLRSLARGEQSAILAAHQRLMERQQRRRAHPDGHLPDPPGTQKQRPESAQEPVAHRQVRSTPASAAQHDQLLLEQESLNDDGSHAAGSTPLRGRDGQVEQGVQDIFQTRDRVGQTSDAVQCCSNSGFSERIGNSRRTGSCQLGPTSYPITGLRAD